MDLSMDSTNEVEKPLTRIKSFDTIFNESKDLSNPVKAHVEEPSLSPAPILLPTDLPDQNKSVVQSMGSPTEHSQIQWHKQMTKVKRLWKRSNLKVWSNAIKMIRLKTDEGRQL